MNLTQLLTAIQNQKYATQPLAAHAIADHDEHLREHYALLLAALLQMRPAVGAAQSQVFAMLLTAMDLANRQAQLLERAQTLTANDLSECRRLLTTEQWLTHSFLLDALVLLRLESPLNDDDLRLCAELMDWLQLDHNLAATLVAMALRILGVSTGQPMPDGFDYSQCPHWLEFIAETVTPAKLKAGLAPGLWLVRDEIQMDSGWSLANLTLVFTDGARLETDITPAAEVTISHCVLINPVMYFAKNPALKFRLEHSVITGRYAEQAQQTALRFDAIESVVIQSTLFNTLNARALQVHHTLLLMAQCQFRGCGNPHLVGGALAVRVIDYGFILSEALESEDVDNIFEFIGKGVLGLEDCQFVDCIARLGHALRINHLHCGLADIKNCLFDNCQAPGQELDLAICVNDIVVSGNRFITDCQFKRGRFYLGEKDLENSGSDDYVFSNLRLVDAQLYAKMRYEDEFKDGITTIGTTQIRADFVYELPTWAEEF